jgi:hypothetical protein
MTTTNGIQVLVSVSIGSLLAHHNFVSAGWEMKITAYPLGQVLKNIAERKQ